MIVSTSHTLGSVISIAKGKKHEITDAPSNKSKRLIGIDDLRNDDLIRYTNDASGTEAISDDVLIAWDGANAGTIGYGKNGYIGSTIARLRIKADIQLFTPFLGMYLKTKFGYLRQTATGATIPHINRNALESIPLPPIKFDDQIRVAHLLSKVEELMAQRKQYLPQLDDLLKSIFLEMFGDPVRNEKGWDIVGIDTVCNDIFLGLTNKVDYVETGGYPLVRTTDIKGGKLSFENAKYISAAQHKKITKNRISKRGDILVSKSGTLGTTAIVDVDEEFTTYESIITIQVNPKLLVNHYLNALLKNQNFQIKMLGGKTGGTVGHLNLLMFREITLPVPTIELQNKFSSIVEKVEGIKTRYQQSLADLEILYGALSQRAFKGELNLSRVPLDKELEHRTESLYSDSEQPPSLFDSQAPMYALDMPAMTSQAGRARLLKQWFSEWLNNAMPGEFVSFDSFWESARVHALDYQADELLDFGTEDYDQVKQWIFDAIASDSLKQTMDTQIVSGDADHSGSRIVLRKAK